MPVAPSTVVAAAPPLRHPGIADWRRSPDVEQILSDSRSIGSTGMTISLLADTGLDHRDVTAWLDRALRPGTGWGHGGSPEPALNSLMWVLADFAGMYPAMTMTATMGWALASAHRRGEALDLAGQWRHQAGAEGLALGWLCVATGLTLDEARQHGANRPAVALMASLRGAALPAAWVAGDAQ